MSIVPCVETISVYGQISAPVLCRELFSQLSTHVSTAYGRSLWPCGPEILTLHIVLHPPEQPKDWLKALRSLSNFAIDLLSLRRCLFSRLFSSR